MRHVSFFLAAAGHVAGLSAQTTKPADVAAASITAAEVARHIRALTDDAKGGRDTATGGIGRTARYVAEQFRQLGLRPGGDIERGRTGSDTATSWFQRYPLPGQLAWNDEASQMTLMTPLGAGLPNIVNERGRRVEKRVTLRFGVDTRIAVDTVPRSGAPSKWKGLAAMSTVVMAGPHTIATVQPAAVRNKLVFYVPPAGTTIAVQQQVIATLVASANKVIVLGPEDSIAPAPRSVVVIDEYMEEMLNLQGWAVAVRPEAIAEWLAAAGVDMARLRAERAAVIREVPSMEVELLPGVRSVAKDTAMAANVVGLLEGRGPKFSREERTPWTEYVVFVARMDSSDAQGSAAGAAGLLALANAFSQPEARPRRSLIFVALNGGANDSRGSEFFTFAYRGESAYRTESLEDVAAALMLDLRGRTAAPDSVWVTGLPDLDFAKRPEWVLAEHPELGLTVVDGGTSASAERAALVRRAVPSLSFHTGHDDASPAPIDAEFAARMLRFVFHVGRGIADTETRPRWSEAGRRNRVTRLGQ